LIGETAGSHSDVGCDAMGSPVAGFAGEFEVFVAAADEG
jgi:hypothetical protein